MASTMDKNGEQARIYNDSDLTMETLDAISDVERSSKDERNPFAGYTAENLQKITINGKPVYINIKTDPDTGDVISAEKSDEAKRYLAAAGARFAELSKELAPAIAPHLQDLSKSLTTFYLDLLKNLPSDFEEIVKVWSNIKDLRPYIEQELKKPEYNGITFDELLNNTEGHEFLEEGSTIYKIYHAAMAAKAKHEEELRAQQAGRETRRELKANAQQANAIMEIRGGNYSIFSQADLWASFTPGRIVKMGEPIKKFIDEKTGRVQKLQFEPGDIETINDPAEISSQAFLLLNSIIKNSVDDPRKTPVEQTDFYKNGGKLRFYVKGVIDAIKSDPRTLIKLQDNADSQQLDINRKTAGALYLEQLFEPLQGYIGTTSNGSRWAVFNYVGYDAETDIMTVQAPYLYQLWHETQAPYFSRQKSKAAQQLAGKKPKRADEKPLELNNLFKGAAYNEDETIMEIAAYITNTLLQAGNKGKAKTTRIKYTTIIKECPRLKSRIDSLQELPAKYTDDEGNEHTRNKSALYNTELRKIARAFDIIQNPEECDATAQYEFINITPAKKNKRGIFELTPPTKSMLQDQIVIIWRRIIKDDESPQ